jgi:hypothetical protein
VPLLDEDYLILSRIHSAEGQQWKSVFVLNVVDGCIPSDLGTGTTTELEEERRLLYFAMTRAKDTLDLLVPQVHHPGTGKMRSEYPAVVLMRYKSHRRNPMSSFRLLGVVAVLSAAIAIPAAAQPVISEPGYCAFFYPNANCQNKGPGNPYTDPNYRRDALQYGPSSGQTVGILPKRSRPHRATSSSMR